MIKTIAAYLLAALAGAGIVYVPHQFFYKEPFLFFGITYYD